MNRMASGIIPKPFFVARKMLSNIEKQSIIKIVCKEAAILSEHWENVDLNRKRVAKAALFMSLSEEREE